MNVFQLRQHLISEYNEYISSFINIKDDKIRDFVETEIEQGLLWPNPLIQLNPSYKQGASIDELVNEGHLNEGCRSIFRIRKDEHDYGQPLRLYKHQEEAIRIYASGAANYVLTTGTGSGKSLAYIIPVVDHILKTGPGKGIQAIFVYPMNALANSQMGELEKFLTEGSAITFKRYTGQENDEEKRQIRMNPPDILLTNYVMLELILTRPEERQTIIQGTENLAFLVLDELHTYRGRQGSDVAMLVRRLRNSIGSQNLRCIGTSATLATEGELSEQRQEIASVATKLFGDQVMPEHIIGETLTRVSPEIDLSNKEFLDSLSNRILGSESQIPQTHEAYINDPLVRWMESIIGVESGKSGHLQRAAPKSIEGEDGAAHLLSELTGIDQHDCLTAIEETLLLGYEIAQKENIDPPFAFRLHQFISRGDTIYASFESAAKRHITARKQQFVPGDRSKILLPMVFCRECGQEYYSVFKSQEPNADGKIISLRDFYDRRDSEEFGEAGYLFFSEKNPWPEDEEEVIEKLPDEWLIITEDETRIRPARRKYLPEHLILSTDGKLAPEGSQAVFINNPFRFCLHCGVSYGFRRRTDIGTLAEIGAGGRSTATTIFALSTIRGLDLDGTLPEKARKLLSFTDNRQDAALQSGHFNDFVQVCLLRSGLYKALDAAKDGSLKFDDLTQAVFDSLDLPKRIYAAEPDLKYQAAENTEKALRDVLGYRLYHDLRRGWRVTSPNLEQCGLLKIEYPWLGDICDDEDLWQDAHEILTSANPKIRYQISKTLLDYMRRELAIKVEYLDQHHQDRIAQASYQYLRQPWAVEENEKLTHAAVLYPRSREDGEYLGNVFLSPLGGYGQYLRHTVNFANYHEKLSTEETQLIITQILKALQTGGLVSVVEQPNNGGVPGFQLSASAMVWKKGDGQTAFHDPIRVPNIPEGGGRTNPFFVDFYQFMAGEFADLQAREHTAQVPYKERETREENFRKGDLQVLFCSPTMELGIDISQLNVVNLRNVPPSPANYAQRSGRAGRSGQPALVFTYCTIGSPHDQYFFRKPEQMVAGSVSPPRLDLSNEELIRSHLQAVWLSETNQSLYSSLTDLLEMEGEDPSLEFRPSVRGNIENQNALNRAKHKGRQILATIRGEIEESDWYYEEWLDQVFNNVIKEFDNACNRWRDLYKAARKQIDLQSKIQLDHTKSKRERNRARKLRQEAVSQIDLLTEAANVVQSDFYSYRYFASEGFLPGYNFPRLPISAYIPARRIKTGEDEFLSRPRFLAISEFGPRAFVYHEGSRYQINRVIMPVTVSAEGEDLLTTRIKLCPVCGYLHKIEHGEGLDRCEHCEAMLTETMAPMFKMQNVATVRRQRITSNEEERTRYGFEIKSAVRFSEHEGKQLSMTASLEYDGEILAEMTYGSATTLWRINLGERRRSKKHQYGFVLDTENGYWAKSDAVEDDKEDPMGPITRRVVPYVEDRKNSLILRPDGFLSNEEMASLTAALKSAIQLVFQLEDSEIAAEPLPTMEDRNAILFYEASEGGAGVLRQLIDDSEAFSQVARQALAFCHFDPDTGEDLGHAEGAKEDCEAACYDCLLSYYNQRDHPLLDRHLIKDLLMRYADSKIMASPESLPRGEHYQNLYNLCESDLERKWLDYVEENGYRLPTDTQTLIETCHTRPDFIYDDEHVVIYVDGYHHLYPDRRQRDARNTECLENLGFTVLRFGLLEEWEQIFSSNTYVFGKKS